MRNRKMSRIAKTFERLRSVNEKALIPYIMAGDPFLERSEEIVLEMERAGADLIELGVPFSDPIADGPVIQRAGQRALKWKTSLGDILRLVAEIRKKSEIPIILMTYYNPILKHGLKTFFKEASRCGVDGLIIPDLSPEEGRGVKENAVRHGLDWILLAAPTTPPKRMALLAKETRGFLYYVSLTGITGASLKDLAEIGSRLSNIRRLTNKPVAVGFGIATPDQARALAPMADGVIVGSAIVKLMEDQMENAGLPSLVAKFVNGLKQAVLQKPPRRFRKTGSAT